MVSCDYTVERETDKAVYCEVKSGYARNTTKYKWLPKTACVIETFVATVDALNNPKEYGKRVTAVAEWLAKAIRKM